MKSVYSIASLIIVLGACGSPQAPAVTGPPIDVKFTRLANAEFGKAYVGQRVRSRGGFAMLLPTLVNMPEQYKTGWVGAILYAAQADGSCDPSKMMAGGGVTMLAPSAVGADWADAKTGSIFEFVAIVQAAETRTVAGGSGNALIIEVESMEPVGACNLGSGTAAPAPAP